MKTPQTLTLDDANKLLAELRCVNCSPGASKVGLRNYTIALLMLDAGLRVREAAQLLQTDLVLNDEPVKAVYVRAAITKTHSERLVPLSQRCQQTIEAMQHLWWKPFKHYDQMYAFFSRESCNHLSTRQVQRIIAAAAEKAIGRPIRPHVLRHTFASRMMRVTSTPVVQLLLGHKRLSSTQIYMHPNQDDLRKAIDAAGE